MKTAPILGFSALLAACAGWIALAPNPARQLLIEAVQAHPLPDGSLVAVLSIENTGPPDRLISASSPKGRAELYSPLEPSGAPVPTGESTLALDGAHLRVFPDGPGLVDGTLIPLTLTFANAGALAVKARLAAVKAEGGANTAGLFGIGDVCVTGEGEPAPKVAIEVAKEDDGWRVRVDSAEFEFTPELLGMMHVPGTGHGHLYVGGMKLGRMLSDEAYIGALPPGRHEVRVTLNTNDHRAYVVGDTPVTATAIIEVD